MIQPSTPLQLVLAQATPPIDHLDFSFVALFANADWVVKIVILVLIGCSGWTWTIIFWKEFFFRRVRKEIDQFETQFWSGTNFQKLKGRLEESRPHPSGRIFVRGMNELATIRSSNQFASERLFDRIERAMDTVVQKEMAVLREYLGFLATVGNIAPFIGLFGTVWGIMSAFQSIAAAQRSSLAVVAPGIAEALFATALGLVAAIPAVVAYNRYTAQTAGIEDSLEKVVDDFSAVLARQFERRKTTLQPGSAATPAGTSAGDTMAPGMDAATHHPGDPLLSPESNRAASPFENPYSSQ